MRKGAKGIGLPIIGAGRVGLSAARVPRAIPPSNGSASQR